MVDVSAAERTAERAVVLLLHGACVALVACAPFLFAGSAEAQQARTESQINTLTDAEREAGWELLFDGQSTDGWRGYMMDAVPDGWQVLDGELTRVGRGRDLITKAQFENFDLTLEWKVELGGNSGILFRAVEGPEQIYMGAPEMQILDDDNHADGRSPLTSVGSNYAIHPAPRGLAHPVGDWNSVRILVDGNHVEHWLNGFRTVEYELGSVDWLERVAASKFSQWPEYGQASKGHIGLQEHGDVVAFRNIKIRRLP
ncbi:MAG TPA: DUF1080 domain-containing protein [Gemmatimonadetes bacterium]|nr:DUF1080 domain-containing protein [Gemmatimonadota bacterium]